MLELGLSALLYFPGPPRPAWLEKEATGSPTDLPGDSSHLFPLLSHRLCSGHPPAPST